MLSLGFRATSAEEEIAGAETAVICVPTPLSGDGGPDLGAVQAAVRSVARHLRPGMLVILESTTYPGTTEEVAAALEDTDAVRSEFADRYATFVEAYCGLVDGQASARVVDRVFGA